MGWASFTLHPVIAQQTVTPEGEKLQKVLARAGLGSRRELERWIEEGRVIVDGTTAKLGDRVSGTERITVDGRPVAARKLVDAPTQVIAYHKPEGQMVTRDDPQQRDTVFDHLPKLKGGRWIAIGRLDLNTSGLLLFTNNGELANALMHPSRQIHREYAVRVHGLASEETLHNLTHGVELDDGPARFEEIVDGGGTGTNHWYYVLIVEGRKREVRRLWESQGLTVNRLIRVRFGSYELPPRLRKGRYCDLTPEEINQLRELAGLAPEKAAARPLPAREKRRANKPRTVNPRKTAVKKRVPRRSTRRP